MAERLRTQVDASVTLTLPDGSATPLSRYVGRQNLVLFFMRAFQ